MLRSPNLQKRASDPEGPKVGVPKIALPHFFGFGVNCKWAQNGGCKKHPKCVPLRGQLPIVWFWVPEGEWACGIGMEGCPAVCILGGGYG